MMKKTMGFALAALAACTLLAGCTSDTAIEAKVKSKLAADSEVKAADIAVTAKEHVVTLRGNLDSEAAKEKVLQIARETSGVTSVIDEIAVRTSETTGDAPDSGRSLGEKVDDAGITMEVKSKLLDDPDVKGLKIDVDTREGVVYLTGTVRSESEKSKAVQLAKNTKGVRDVQPNLDILGS
jgi:hyperosmotically inducible protein